MHVHFEPGELEFEPEVRLGSDPAKAQRNLAVLGEHGDAERRGDLTVTMATVHRDNPFQIYPAGGVNIWGWDNVREFYRERFLAFGGRVLFAHRVLVTDDAICTLGWFKAAPEGIFFGTPSFGRPLFFPVSVWVYFKDGLVLGESGYWDGALVAQQIAHGATGDVRTPLY